MLIQDPLLKLRRLQQGLNARPVISHLLAKLSLPRIDLPELAAIVNWLENHALYDWIFKTAILRQGERLAQNATVIDVEAA